MNAPSDKGSASKKKAPMSNKVYLSIWVPILALATVLVIGVNYAIGVAGGWVTSQLGAGTYTFTNSEESSGLGHRLLHLGVRRYRRRR